MRPGTRIDPPFPVGFFGDEKLVVGAYINGGIFPLVGGELALAAFEHGREAYGVETLRTYADLVARTGESYLWYFHDGTPSSVDTSTSPEALPTDGWGSTAMLMGLVAGLAGVRDLAHSFTEVSLQPRWVAAGEADATVQLAYEASGAGFAYTYRHDAEAHTIRLEIEGKADVVVAPLLPAGTEARSVVWEGVPCAPQTLLNEGAGESCYGGTWGRVDGRATVEVTYG